MIQPLEPLPLYICTLLAFRTLCSGRPLVCISEENKTTQKTPTVSIFRLSTTRLAAATFVVDHSSLCGDPRKEPSCTRHTYIYSTPHEFLPGQQLDGIWTKYEILSSLDPEKNFLTEFINEKYVQNTFPRH